VSELSPKQRVLAALKRDGTPVDRIPVIGASQTGSFSQMAATNTTWPDAHLNAEQMARLAMAIHTHLGWDAVRVPFDQTFEAVALGAVWKSGGADNVPHANPHPTYKLGEEFPFPDDFLSRGYLPVLIEAVRIIKRELGDRVAVIGGIIGPYTIAGGVLGISKLAKESFKNPQRLEPVFDTCERAGTMLAQALIEAGADAICVEDMAGSTDLISPEMFASIVAPYEKKQFAQIGVPTMLHICGDVTPILPYMAETGTTAISYEARVDTAAARKRVGDRVALICGPDAGRTLFSGTPEQVENECRQQIELGADIIAPGCAVAPGTPPENLMAMLEAVQKYGKR
jgi:[methyl-Co(III) methanol-specific corrinoid protein]:coenzyme M methyltransferase